MTAYLTIDATRAHSAAAHVSRTMRALTHASPRSAVLRAVADARKAEQDLRQFRREALAVLRPEANDRGDVNNKGDGQ